jgi:hypothetical protein
MMLRPLDSTVLSLQQESLRELEVDRPVDSVEKQLAASNMRVVLTRALQNGRALKSKSPSTCSVCQCDDPRIVVLLPVGKDSFAKKTACGRSCVAEVYRSFAAVILEAQFEASARQK